MKSEPLKGKSNCKNTICYRNKGGLCYHYFDEQDIKSAVEWLEERQTEEWIKYENGEISLPTLKYNLRTRQLKAFEDVTKSTK